jgi:hypothetical protein
LVCLYWGRCYGSRPNKEISLRTVRWGAQPGAFVALILVAQFGHLAGTKSAMPKMDHIRKILPSSNPICIKSAYLITRQGDRQEAKELFFE